MSWCCHSTHLPPILIAYSPFLQFYHFPLLHSTTFLFLFIDVIFSSRSTNEFAFLFPAFIWLPAQALFSLLNFLHFHQLSFGVLHSFCVIPREVFDFAAKYILDFFFTLRSPLSLVFPFQTVFDVQLLPSAASKKLAFRASASA